AKAGRVRRAAMFQRLRQGSHMRARADASEAAVEFTTRASRIARVHQQGLVDRVRPGGPRVAYARRELLGFTRADVKLLQQRVLEHLAGASL
ncbi:MAG: phage virion morphogenesis protein, partial [Flavobacteriales bacterium]